MIDLLRARRSCRKFQETKVEQAKIALLKEALLRSPSSKNINPWEFIVIDQPELINSLSACKPHGASFLKNAPLAVVVVADEALNDVWVEDTSIASILLQLTAQSLGLGSCWVQIRKRDHDDKLSAEAYVQELLGIPESFRVLSIIAIGYPLKQRDGKPFGELQQEKIHFNGFR